MGEGWTVPVIILPKRLPAAKLVAMHCHAWWDCCTQAHWVLVQIFMQQQRMLTYLLLFNLFKMPTWLTQCYHSWDSWLQSTILFPQYCSLLWIWGGFLPYKSLTFNVWSMITV
jgi:hypothetical protein